MLKFNNPKMKMGSLEFPDAIFIDMDNTIYEYSRCHNKAIKALESYLKNKISMPAGIFREGYEKARQQIHLRLDNTASSHNRLLYFQYLLEQAGCDSMVSLALKMNDIYWKTFISNIRLFGGVVEFLECAKKLKLPVAFITDLLADIQFRKIRHLRLENKFDILVTSEEAGRDKPAPAIFKLALKKLGRIPRTVWMIGDGYHQDIAGGKTIGAITFQKSANAKIVRSSKNCKADFLFNSFYALIDLLSRFEKNERK